MPVARMIVEIVIAALAVFGVFAAMRLLFLHICSPTAFAAAVEIVRPMAEEEVVFLLSRVRESFFLRSGGRVVALVDHSLRKDVRLIAALLNGGAVIHFVKLLGEEE